MEATGLLQKRLEEDICGGNAGQRGEEEVYFYFFYGWERVRWVLAQCFGGVSQRDGVGVADALQPGGVAPSACARAAIARGL